MIQVTVEFTVDIPHGGNGSPLQGNPSHGTFDLVHVASTTYVDDIRHHEVCLTLDTGNVKAALKSKSQNGRVGEGTEFMVGKEHDDVLVGFSEMDTDSETPNSSGRWIAPLVAFFEMLHEYASTMLS